MAIMVHFYKKRQLLFLLIIVIIAVVSLLSCEDTEDTNVDCSTYDYMDCDTKEPLTGKFRLSVTINNENPSVPIVIYKGKLEENIVFFVDTVYEENYDTLLPAGNFYTATAKYKKDNSIIIAVDGDKVSKSSKKTCDSTCWTVKDGKAYLGLK